LSQNMYIYTDIQLQIKVQVSKRKAAPFH